MAFCKNEANKCLFMNGLKSTRRAESQILRGHKGHFLAIALMYREDYARAGYRMLPDFDLDSRFTRAEIVGFTLVLIVTTMLPLVGRGGPVYIVGMLLAGIFMLYHVAKLAQSTSKALASRVVHASVIYLPVVLLIMITHKG
jgi:protoheme IX farnesyltransferase